MGGTGLYVMEWEKGKTVIGRMDGWMDRLLGGRKIGNVIVDLKFECIDGTEKRERWGKDERMDG